MEIRIKPFGCLDGLGCLFSLGFLPIVLWFTVKRIPQGLTEEGIILPDGNGVHWYDITDAKITKFHVGRAKTYNESRVVLKHTQGVINFRTRRIQNEAEVMQYLVAHLPQQALNQNSR